MKSDHPGKAPLIRCFNVKFSPNLGDGLLSECLEEALIHLGADPATNSIDLAARNAYGDAMIGRSAIMKALEALPPAVRSAVVGVPLRLTAARTWRPHYALGLASADAVVIGGGNLISDIDLNFPTKLSVAIEEAEKRNLPVAIYACGMATKWSRRGLAMCQKTFSSPNLKAVFLRDTDSAVLWNELMTPQTGHAAQVVRDPGLLASEVYPYPARPKGRRLVAGLGIMSQIAIRYHAEGAPSSERLDQWYVDVAREMILDGMQVRVFTNGSPEDSSYAVKLHGRLRALGDDSQITFLTQREPRELCAHIADFDVLVAYRMHAVIIAYSYGVPAIALAWDRKLASFMASVDRTEWLIDVMQISAKTCVDMVRRAATAGIDPTARARIIGEARADVAKVWHAVQPRGTA